MADHEEEAELQAKLEHASTYEERAKYRRALRELRKKKADGGQQQSGYTQARRGSAVYKRFGAAGPSSSGSQYVGAKAVVSAQSPGVSTQSKQRSDAPGKMLKNTKETIEKKTVHEVPEKEEAPTVGCKTATTPSTNGVEGERREKVQQTKQPSYSSSEEPSGPNEKDIGIVGSSTEQMSSPTEQTSSPTEQTPSPTKQTSSPTEQMSSPTEQTSGPTEQTSSPIEQTSSPVEQMATPIEQTSSLFEHTTCDTKKTSSPTDKTPSPTEHMSSAVAQTSSPTERISSDGSKESKIEKKSSFRGEDVDFRRRNVASDKSSADPKEDFYKVKLRKTSKDTETKPKSPLGQAHDQPPEFQNFRLRKVESSRPRATTWAGSRPRGPHTTPGTKESSSMVTTGPTSKAPSTRTTPRSTSTSQTPRVEIPKNTTSWEMSTEDMDKCLEQFVSRVLKYPSAGQTLSGLCRDPKVLCELINLCVKGTVDMRALTVVKTGGRKEEAVAREENMTLAVESARAIGCQITESTHSKLLSGDKATCRQIVFDLVKAKAVNLPGMKDAPQGMFQSPALIFAVFGIIATGQDQPDVSRPSQPKKETQRSNPPPTSVVNTPVNNAKEKDPPVDSPRADVITDKNMEELTYEERAARRRAAREKRKQERAQMASKP